MTTFSNYLFKEYIFKTLKRINFTNPTEIQQKVIPLALKGKSIIGRSPTGSGKTMAYLLPILNKIDLSLNKVQAVIMLPTRELSTQVYKVLEEFSKEEPQLKLRLITGGTDRQRMIEKVATVPHIIIGTPGRINDITLNQGKLNIMSAEILILDEADMIMEAGFLEDVSKIAAKMKDTLQMMVFSATIPGSLRQFLNVYMSKPELVETSKDEVNPGTITHVLVPDHHRDKKDVILELIKGINPYLAIIFVTNKKDIDALYDVMRNVGLNVGVIHGDLTPNIRKTMMKRIQNNEFTYIVASDIAARGIDIKGVTHIINYDLPYEIEYFYHRAGRTGRNGEEGICYTLYHKEDIPVIKKLMDKVNFQHQEYKSGEWVTLKPLGYVFKKKKEPTELDIKIRQAVSKNKKTEVKPGYKKKLKEELDTIRRKHKREIIKNDIKKQIRQRAIAKNKAKQEGEL